MQTVAQQTVAHEWELRVERGPNWLLVKILSATDGRPTWSTLANRLRSLLDRYFTYRLVLDVEHIRTFNAESIGELLALQRWVCDRQGVLRLCGLSPENSALFRCCGLTRLFPVYHDRLEAIWDGDRPRQPR